MDEIENIKKLEHEIDGKIEKGRAAAKKEVEDYKAKMPGLLEKEKEKARAKAGREVESAKVEGEREAERILADADSRVKQISATGKKNFEPAVDVVIAELS